MPLYAHFCADLKSPEFQIVSSFSTVGVSFKLKLYMLLLFYLNDEPICYYRLYRPYYIRSKLRDIEWKGLKKLFTEIAPLLVHPGNLCPSLHVYWYKLLGCMLLGVSITSRNERVGCHSRCTKTEVSLLCMF